MADAVILVPTRVWDRLAAVAKSRGMSVPALVEEFAESTLIAKQRAELTLTAQERRERAERTRAYMAKHFGIEISDEESAAMGARIRAAFAELRSTTK